MQTASLTRAIYVPQGTCPRAWVASVGDIQLRDGRGALRRFATAEAASLAAEQALAAFRRQFGRDDA